MKLAIMQPYLFPYLGYFQLIHAVDKFVIYDDVTYIKQGWINRNNILVNGKPYLFTLPLEQINSYKQINETKIYGNLYNNWYKKFEKTLIINYKKAPHFEDVFFLITNILKPANIYSSISDLCEVCIKSIIEYLNIDTKIEKSSSIYSNKDLSAAARVFDICKKENATTYINPIGGIKLYSKEDFRSNFINLYFIKSGEIVYKQFDQEFIPNLSIIDTLMFNSRSDIEKQLNNYNLE